MILNISYLSSNQKDTSEYVIEEIEINAKKDEFNNRMLPIEHSAIYSGKKTELINIKDLNFNLSGNSNRQLFSKVSGLNIWEGDASGSQISIGGRGLSPSRISNFNTRQNGYDISADALGYPESYYTPPVEALERIEVVRGASSLQYGTQFGGFLNFRLQSPHFESKNEFISRQSGSSFGNINTFNSANISQKDFAFYSYIHFKNGTGWRQNTDFNQIGAHINFLYKLTENSKINFEYTKMNYLNRQPGGITDFEFANNPQLSTRNRNWFYVDWNLFAVNFDYKLNNNTDFNLRNFALVAERNSLGVLGRTNRVDMGGARDLIVGNYQNYGTEGRILNRTFIFGNLNAFLAGFRLYKGFTYQKQGEGSDGSDADFNFTKNELSEFSEFRFPGWNFSFFAEDMFHITDNFTITPGIRFENINTNANGTYKDLSYGPANDIIENSDTIYSDSRSNNRTFLLKGLGLAYYLGKEAEIYTNFTENYRAINFNDMRIINPNQRIDYNLKDEKGWSYDFGLRGTYSNIIDYDFNFFYLHYSDKIGDLPGRDSILGTTYKLRTNISDALSYGLESFFEISIFNLINMKTESNLSLFANFSIINAQYKSSQNPLIDGKNLELSPNLILRSGVNYKLNKFKISIGINYLSEQFTDATNTVFSGDAIYGVIPSYYVMDLNVAYSFKYLQIVAGTENLTNNLYFTRRAAGYPGPGIIPSDGRSFYLNFNFNY